MHGSNLVEIIGSLIYEPKRGGKGERISPLLLEICPV